MSPEGLPSLPAQPTKDDRDAVFLRTVHELGPRVTRFIARIVGRPDIAEDLAQDVFVHVLRHEGAWPPEDRMTVWVLRIARNVALDHLRRHTVRQRAKHMLESWADQRERRRTRTRIAPPLEQLSDEELFGAVSESMNEIPEVYRTPLQLREQEGLSYEEIAEVLDISAKTVSTRLVRGRRHLRERMEQRFGSLADHRFFSEVAS